MSIFLKRQHAYSVLPIPNPHPPLPPFPAAACLVDKRAFTTLYLFSPVSVDMPPRIPFPPSTPSPHVTQPRAPMYKHTDTDRQNPTAPKPNKKTQKPIPGSTASELELHARVLGDAVIDGVELVGVLHGALDGQGAVPPAARVPGGVGDLLRGGARHLLACSVFPCMFVCLCVVCGCVGRRWWRALMDPRRKTPQSCYSISYQQPTRIQFLSVMDGSGRAVPRRRVGPCRGRRSPGPPPQAPQSPDVCVHGGGVWLGDW